MKKLLYILIIPLIFAFNLHKYHLSNTKIVFKKEQQAVQITMRYFVDDIEATLNKSNDTIFELGNDRELKNSDTYIKKYITSKFNVQINKIQREYKYIGKELEKDIIFFYLEIDSVKSIKNINIMNTVLFEEFEDQQNIIRLRINDKKKTFLLKKDKMSEFYEFSY